MAPTSGPTAPVVVPRPGRPTALRQLAGLGFLVVVATAGQAVGWGPEPRQEANSAKDETIAVLIRQLGDASYEKRQAATRRLCAIGAPAAPQLRAVAGDDNTETSLRARSILGIIDELMFTGVEVQLAFSKETIAWHDAVDLSVTMTNRSDRPARVPFEVDSARRAETPEDALQVGDLLDIADCVHVVRHDGETIELKVDDISADPAVAEVVQSRMNSGPVTVLKPGERVTLTVQDFNRGWARFPTLDAGVYTVMVDYVPPWKDDVLAAERVGRVISNAVSLRVTDGAPESVSRTGLEASVRVRRDGGDLVAEVTNHTDQYLVVNRNFGSAAPFAQGQWVCESSGGRKDVPVVSKARASWNEFDAARLIQVPPGQSLELTRIAAEELRRTLAGADLKAENPSWSVAFVYVNLCNRPWQVRQGTGVLGNASAPAVLQAPLPRRMLSARHSSDRMTLGSVD